MNDDAFLEWTRHQRSCISGTFGQFVDSTDDEGLNDPAHVRRAGPSGTAYKPPYSAVALTHDEHDLQHRRGEATCLVRFLPADKGGTYLRKLSYVEQLLWAEKWFDDASDANLAAWLDTLERWPDDLPVDKRERMIARSGVPV